ncbi:MAG: hypothetical protein B6226_02770 [Candidatus Cloacimonetes bacterium 4572_65]|nr:MAG: hypothetical protein B6226_02770 [Candidatus Cloacimonetes bacterium 4572_65]
MKIWFIVVVCICFQVLTGAVVINELFYDAQGSDEGEEWIELYNNGSDDVNLQYWIIQRAGVSFETIYQFPIITIRAGTFFLITESYTPSSNIITELNFQNGGSETDGVKIIDLETHYSDTILYDSPNTNNLQGDLGESSLCEDVPPGNSLARIDDGVDTNSSEDWYNCSFTTPGASNVVAAVVTLDSAIITYNQSSIDISTKVTNLSTHNVDNSVLLLRIFINSELEHQVELEGILANSTLTYCYTMINELDIEGEVMIELSSNEEVSIVDNMWTGWISSSLEPLLIKFSEVMFKPISGNGEWLEILLAEDIPQTEVEIIDKAGNNCNAYIEGNSGDYLVLAEDRESLLSQYPNSNPINIIQAEGWVRLNNSGDEVILKINNTTIDSLSFLGSDCSDGSSWEYNEITASWNQCLSEYGATPTAEPWFSTQQYPSNNGVEIVSKLISQRKGVVFEVGYKYEEVVSEITLKLFDIRGRELFIISEEVSSNVGLFKWNGRDKTNYLTSGIYPAILTFKDSFGNILYAEQLLITVNR